MKPQFVRILIAGSTAVLAFVSVALLIAFLSSIRVPAPIQGFIPNEDTALARIGNVISPSIESNLQLFHNDRLIRTPGHIDCDEGEMVRVEVTLTQDSTGALAKGHTQDFCTGGVQSWEALTVARGPIQFETGDAQACAVATTRFRNQITDTFAWCKDVILEQE